MAEAKIEVRVGEVSFTGEGESVWLAEQLDKILAAAPKLSKITTQPAQHAPHTPPGAPSATGDGALKETLASYIKAKNADSNQVRRFLVTADWLRRRNSGGELTTAAVSKALQDHHQKRLANASDCLNQNVSKGFCEKKGKAFFITPEGLEELGHAS